MSVPRISSRLESKIIDVRIFQSLRRNNIFWPKKMINWSDNWSAMTDQNHMDVPTIYPFFGFWIGIYHEWYKCIKGNIFWGIQIPKLRKMYLFLEKQQFFNLKQYFGASKLFAPWCTLDSSSGLHTKKILIVWHSGRFIKVNPLVSNKFSLIFLCTHWEPNLKLIWPVIERLLNWVKDWILTISFLQIFKIPQIFSFCSQFSSNFREWDFHSHISSPVRFWSLVSLKTILKSTVIVWHWRSVIKSQILFRKKKMQPRLLRFTHLICTQHFNTHDLPYETRWLPRTTIQGNSTFL